MKSSDHKIGEGGKVPSVTMTATLKHAAFALMNALYADAVDKAPLTDRQREDAAAAAGAVKDLIITFGWLDEFNARDGGE